MGRDDVSPSVGRSAAPSLLRRLLWWAVAVIGAVLGLAGPSYLMYGVGSTRARPVPPRPVLPAANPQPPESSPSLPSPDDWLEARLLSKPVATRDSPERAAKIQELCSFCHLLPTPEIEPWEQWPRKIAQMYHYMRGSRPIPEDRLPPIEEVIAYWASRAPDSLVLPDDAWSAPPAPLPFARHLIRLDAIPHPPAVSCVKFVQLDDDGPTQLLISDLRHGVVVLWTPSRPTEPARVIAHVPHPSHTTVVDLDGDGRRDILVANMGVFGPRDTDQGSVVWLRNRGQGQFEPIVLKDKLGRVNDVQAADFDGDGKLDLVVGVFGNLTTGMLLYLDNCTTDWSHPDFEPICLDSHPGTSEVPVVDLNQDGHPDFLILQAQESERIVAFLNRGWGSFFQKPIYQAPHPRWGSITIRLADMDGDGDRDVLYAHGDMTQNPPTLRPYHGVSLLENKGTFPFTYHRLAHFPGVTTAFPVDLDGDGRLDIVSSAFIPALDWRSEQSGKLDSVIWLRQTAPLQFQRYSLETRYLIHACGDVGDIDGDGDSDIVLGSFLWGPSETAYPQMPCLTVLENRWKDNRPHDQLQVEKE